MDLGAIDWSAAAACLALAVMAYRSSLAGERAYAAALILNVIAFNVVGCCIPQAGYPGLNLILEFGLFEIAVLSAIVTMRTRPFLELVFISVLSMIVSVNQALRFWPIDGYYLLVNALFACECAIIGRRGIGNVVGRIFRLVRNSGRDGRVLDRPRVLDHGLASVLRRTRNRRT